MPKFLLLSFIFNLAKRELIRAAGKMSLITKKKLQVALVFLLGLVPTLKSTPAKIAFQKKKKNDASDKAMNLKKKNVFHILTFILLAQV